MARLLKSCHPAVRRFAEELGLPYDRLTSLTISFEARKEVAVFATILPAEAQIEGLAMVTRRYGLTAHDLSGTITDGTPTQADSPQDPRGGPALPDQQG